MLAVARHHADLALAALQRTDQRAGDTFFVERFGVFAACAHLHDGLAFARDIVGARQGRVLQQIDILNFELGRKIA
jgi:hypothetical protein